MDLIDALHYVDLTAKILKGGTAPCSLLTKKIWLLSPKETRGPPPFKAPLPTGKVICTMVNSHKSLIGTFLTSFYLCRHGPTSLQN